MTQRISKFCASTGIPLLHYAVLLLVFGLLAGFCESIEPTATQFLKTVQRGQYDEGRLNVCNNLSPLVRQTTRACDF